jgi:hypothetical protein
MSSAGASILKDYDEISLLQAELYPAQVNRLYVKGAVVTSVGNGLQAECDRPNADC